MKKTVLIIALFIALFMGCNDDEIQKVEVVNTVYDTWEKADPVTSLTVQKTNDGTYIIVSWNAVKNGYEYNIYIKQEGKNTIIDTWNNWEDDNYIQVRAQYKFIYSLVDGSTSTNTDIDKWSARFKTSHGISGAKYSFGVVAGSLVAGSLHANSEITWSNYILF